MADPKWTKGEWSVSSYEGGWTCVRDDHGGIIAKLGLNNEANAHLIAAAPRLQMALEALLDDFSQMLADPDLLQMALEMARMGRPLDFSDGGPQTVKNARAALAAAKGGE